MEVTLEELRVTRKRNNDKFSKIIKEFDDYIEQVYGTERKRPKHPVESKILKRFKYK